MRFALVFLICSSIGPKKVSHQARRRVVVVVVVVAVVVVAVILVVEPLEEALEFSWKPVD